MPRNDSPRPSEEPAAANERSRRSAMARTTADVASPIELTRRGALRTTAGLGVAALGLGTTPAGSAAAPGGDGGIAEFQTLSVGDDNRIVNEDGEPFVLRGLTIPDPKRLHRTRHLRGKTPAQIVDLVTDYEAGWYPRVLRVPASPVDIGEHPMGYLGPEYEDGELESPEAVRDDRRKECPPQPPAFTREQLEAYVDEHLSPVVERCRERGVYCIVDYHRHWHEQPPGTEGPWNAENHLPYDSEYTNYWAYNTYDGDDVSFGEDAPASFGHVDTAFREVRDWPPEWTSYETPDAPYYSEHWQVNEALLEEALLFWDVVAERFGDEPHVVFEPYDEPTAPAISAPVDGCGAIWQKPLWETYVDEFVGPIVERIREYQPEQVLLVGTPGRCTSLQALHWRSFADAGYENVAVTYHNHGDDDVSELQNWLNDTEYQSPEDVAAETGGELDDPYVPPPESNVDPDCWGYERYESRGLQEAMEQHPVVVSDFGWQYPSSVGWTRPITNRSTNEYGVPFLDAMESDDRISWIASTADVRWEPKLFEYPDGPALGELEDHLVNDSFYETPIEDLPRPCEAPPCEWHLLGGEDSGEYLKDRLQTYAETDVPFEFDAGEDGPCVEVDGRTVCDVNGDGHYRDATGNGEVGQTDVVEFFRVQHREAWKRPELFDFSGNGSVGHGDVVQLFEHVATR